MFDCCLHSFLSLLPSGTPARWLWQRPDVSSFSCTFSSFVGRLLVKSTALESHLTFTGSVFLGKSLNAMPPQVPHLPETGGNEQLPTGHLWTCERLGGMRSLVAITHVSHSYVCISTIFAGTAFLLPYTHVLLTVASLGRE